MCLQNHLPSRFEDRCRPLALPVGNVEFAACPVHGNHAGHEESLLVPIAASHRYTSIIDALQVKYLTWSSLKSLNRSLKSEFTLVFAAMVAFGEFPCCVKPGRGGLALPEFYVERAIAVFDLQTAPLPVDASAWLARAH